MTPALTPMLLLAGLVGVAALGPRLIRSAAPALARRPRSAVVLLAGTVVVWLVAFASIGPMLAWALTGETVTRSGGICRRCLEASYPWSTPIVETGLPTVVLMYGPAVVVLGLLVTVLARLRGADAESRRHGLDIRGRSHRASIHGVPVRVLPESEPRAFALPRRHGGIVITSGALAILTDDETKAVLAHEQAHLAQRHHLIAAISRHLEALVHPVAVLRTATSAIPLYLEIAADNAARRRVGTRPLVSALVQLSSAEPRLGSPGAALHATGEPSRIDALLDVTRTPAPGARLFSASAQGLVLGALTVSALIPLMIVATGGCA